MSCINKHRIGESSVRDFYEWFSSARCVSTEWILSLSSVSDFHFLWNIASPCKERVFKCLQHVTPQTSLVESEVIRLLPNERWSCLIRNVLKTVRFVICWEFANFVLFQQMHANSDSKMIFPQTCVSERLNEVKIEFSVQGCEIPASLRTGEVSTFLQQNHAESAMEKEKRMQSLFEKWRRWESDVATRNISQHVLVQVSMWSVFECTGGHSDECLNVWVGMWCTPQWNV